MATNTIDIPAIREQIKSILDLNNTTGSALIDLSQNMSKRVQKVAKINPQNFPLQANLYPAVTIHTTAKPIEPKTIAANQINGKRLAKLNFQITGHVWNQNFLGDIFDDPAENDLEYLMENIEGVLRNYPDLSGVANWQIPNNVTYHTASFDEQTHLRIGLMDIELTIYY